METKRKKAAKGKKRAVMCRHPHRLPVFSPLGVCWESGSRPLTHRAVRRCCSVVSHSIVFEYVRLSRMGATQHCPVFLERRAGLTFSEGSGLSRCQASLASALPLCAVAGATAPLVLPRLLFLFKKPVENHEDRKNVGFSLPGSCRGGIHAVGCMLNRKAVVPHAGVEPARILLLRIVLPLNFAACDRCRSRRHTPAIHRQPISTGHTITQYA